LNKKPSDIVLYKKADCHPMVQERYPWLSFKEQVRGMVEKALKDLGVEPGEIVLETPPPEKGDLAYPSFQVCKHLKCSPPQAAQMIKDHIKEEGILIETAGPYLNFSMDNGAIIKDVVKTIMSMDKEYGTFPSNNTKVIVEHTSANPTDRLHVGRARNPIIGDTIARVMRAAGYEVETQYYVDNVGRQAVTLALGMKYYTPESSPPHVSIGPEEWAKLKQESLGAYQCGTAGVAQFEAICTERDEMLMHLEHGEKQVTDMVLKATENILDERIKPTLERLNIHVDKYVPESNFMEDLDQLIDKLKASKYCGTSKNGAQYLDLKEFGIDKEFYFLRSDGTSVYATRDIAYHIWKGKRADKMVNILGEDHRLESISVSTAIKDVLDIPIDLDVVFYSFVGLPEGKMSTRKGQVVFIDDLLDEAVGLAKEEVLRRRQDLSEEQVNDIAEAVGIGAVRYNILRIQPEKRMVFKWEDALNFEGNSAPFIQYALARCCGIIEKCEECKDYDLELLTHESELLLAKQLSLMPNIILEITSQKNPQRLPAYAQEVASALNQFYRDCPVSQEEQDIKMARLALVNAAAVVLRNCLELMGIRALEEM